MSNPARRLHDIFRHWSRTSKTAHDARGFNIGDGAAFAEHLEAMQCLVECSKILDRFEQEGRPLNVYRRNSSKWLAAIINFPHSWVSGAGAQAFDTNTMDTLDAFALHLDGYAPLLNPEYAPKLDKLLGDVEQLLTDDASLSPQIRGHVYEVVKMLRRYLADAEMYGQADIAQALYDLWVALGCAAGDASDETRDKWRTFRDDILKPAVAGLIAGVPSIVLAIGQ